MEDMDAQRRGVDRPDDGSIGRAAALLARSRSVLVLTGAGVSAESGVPTFRDAQTGLWARYDPQTLASPQGFASDPGLVWRWYMARFGSVRGVAPNPGHHALALLERWLRRGDRSFSLFTQNIDDLHERAGSLDVHHLHGSIHRYRCSACGCAHALLDEEREAQEPPSCASCRAPVRPDIVWFGENLPVEVLDRAWSAVQECDLALVAGTSGEVYPAAQLPHSAKQLGAFLIDVNPEPTRISAIADVYLQGASGDLLPELVRRAMSLSSSPSKG